MSIVNSANIKKTVYYLKRNGLRSTVGALRERLDPGSRVLYRWEPVSEEEKERQRRHAAEGFSTVRFSIVVPTYRTPERYLREMITSVINQTYPHWELILADATEDAGTTPDDRGVTAGAAPGPGEGVDSVIGGAAEGNRIRAAAEAYGDSRIRYFRLPSNGGIADNTNQGIALAEGDYVGLLDHDDLLAENALYEMAARIEEERRKGTEPRLLYSDEDKCDGDGTEFYDPNLKEDFNLDLLLSNNYVCHFMVMERSLIQRLLLRREYDGAQDYDLVLRGTYEILAGGQEKEIVHIPLVLYHWRCHTGSTAENPQSKLYAYEAGKRAVQAFAHRMGWRAEAVDTEHLGFYRLEYEGDILRLRPDLAAVGGPVIQGGRIAGGRMSRDGGVYYEGLPASYSGYLHRAALQQDAEALDIRNIAVREELRELFEKIAGVSYVTLSGTDLFNPESLPAGTDYRILSVKLGQVFREQGYRLLYLPERKQYLGKKGRPARKCPGREV